VEKVVFGKSDQLTSAHHVPFIIRWDIVLRDGRVYSTESNVTPDLKMIIQHMRLMPAENAAPGGL
jgi:hypothetical protein